MPNELTDYEHSQLVNGGVCALHTHPIVLRDHQHIDTLQSMEKVTEVNTNYVATYNDDIIVMDTAAGNRTVTIPKSRGGKKFYVLKSDAANSLTILFSAGETSLGAASIVLTALGAGKWLKAVVGGYIPL